MSDQTDPGAPLMARVIEVDATDDVAPRRPLAPRIIPTERTERVTPSEPAPVAVVARDAPRRKGIRDARAVDAATDHHDVGGLSHWEGHSFRRIPYHVASPANRFTSGLGRCL